MYGRYLGQCALCIIIITDKVESVSDKREVPASEPIMKISYYMYVLHTIALKAGYTIMSKQ